MVLASLDPRNLLEVSGHVGLRGKRYLQALIT